MKLCFTPQTAEQTSISQHITGACCLTPPLRDCRLSSVLSAVCW